MEILTQCDQVDDEMLRRARARIGGNATAARFGRFADCQASAGVPWHNGQDNALCNRGAPRFDVTEVPTLDHRPDDRSPSLSKSGRLGKLPVRAGYPALRTWA